MKTVDKQKGAALIVTLVLLVVALILGLSSYQSSRLEEAMAGNYRASSSALMAAEYAASDSWQASFKGVVDPGASSAFATVTLPTDSEYQHLGAYYFYQQVSNGLYDVVAIGEVQQDPSVYRYLEYLARLAVGPGAALVAASDKDDPDCSTSTTIIPPTSNADFIGEEIFGSLKAAVQVGCPEAANALIEEITNKDVDKVAETSDTNPDIQTCIDSPSNKFCNYVGGVQSSIDIDIFKNPEKMAEFMDSLRKNLWLAEWDSSNPTTDPATPASIVHNLADANGRNGITFLTPTVWKAFDGTGSDDVESDDLHYTDTAGDPQSAEGSFDWVGYDGVELLDSYPDGDVALGEAGYDPSLDTNADNVIDDLDRENVIAGALDVGGSGTLPRVNYSTSGQFSGSGVLVVDGNVSFNGVPSFDGLIIVLGDYTVTGGGGTIGDFNGSVVAAPISGTDLAPEFTAFNYGNPLTCHSSSDGCGFDDKTMEIGGGGDSQYDYDLDELLKSVALLEATGAKAGDQTANELFAYGDGSNPLGFYVTNYRQAFERPQVLIDYLTGNPGALPND